MIAIEAGRCYSNGTFGRSWSVRRVLAIEPAADGELVTYRIVVGAGRRRIERASSTEFAKWARHEVVQAESEWVRVR